MRCANMQFANKNSFGTRNIYPKSEYIYIYIFIVNTTLRTLCRHLSSVKCFGCSWPSSGKFHNYVHGNIYRSGGFIFVLNILKYVRFEYYELLGSSEIYTIIGKNYGNVKYMLCVAAIFHWHKILPIALWPWGRLSL